MKNVMLRDHAKEIFQAGLRAVDPVDAIKKFVRLEGETLHVASSSYVLSDFEHLYVVGGGKAGAAMAGALEDILGERITAGWVNVKYEHLAPTKIVTVHEAGHPVPDEAGVAGTRKLIEMIEPCTEKDLVICVISGGGSALLPAPVAGISLKEKQAVTTSLLRCGATIHEMNTIRKHISALKGGQLARIVSPASLISLMISDVVGDPLDTIASGPSVPDEHSFTECLAILDTYGIRSEIPASVLDRLMKGEAGEIADTPKPGDPLFEKTQNVIVAGNALAAQAAAVKAEELGYRTLILATGIEGETREVAKVHAAILREICRSGNPLAPPACLISGGETTVTIQGDGLGGRNQEFVLAAVPEIAGLSNVAVLSAGTDGTDGPTDAAGALADGRTLARADALQLDPTIFLQKNDSYHFFDKLEDLFKTGPTNTNVMDLRILLAGD
ncbi:glycerate kinase [candidate division KSB3 bacterium]|uniref:Glycerate kinase n=1 Tax=candidate division KSB3 bacterium TaxID=2044937 RepID=A0A2G6E3H3_9BACT|nr:MAG: glycerate kinase [candidate division KSB3 bacterium]PIE29172.1 MAG: glycerate kinase [candidate division KSB3 bacterium]